MAALALPGACANNPIARSSATRLQKSARIAPGSDERIAYARARGNDQARITAPGRRPTGQPSTGTC
jgi:hypothetical protein